MTETTARPERAVVLKYRYASQSVDDCRAFRFRTAEEHVAAAELRPLLERDGAGAFGEQLRFWSDALQCWLGVEMPGVRISALPTAVDPVTNETAHLLALLLEDAPAPACVRGLGDAAAGAEAAHDALALAVQRLENKLDVQARLGLISDGQIAPVEPPAERPHERSAGPLDVVGPTSASSTTPNNTEDIGSLDEDVEPSHFTFLDLAVLSANPLVFVHDRQYHPLDHTGALDFKGEWHLLRSMLQRTMKRVCARVDIASTGLLSEVLMQRPRCLYLVCHADYATPAAGGPPSLHLSLEDSSGVCDSVSLERLKALLRGGADEARSEASDDENVRPLSGVGVVVLGACHSLEAGRAFVAAGCKHVVAIASDAKVLDDDAALFARHFLFALFQGQSVRSAFERGKGVVASAANPRVLESTDSRAFEADKIVLLPEGAPHDERPMASLSRGELFELNPLPALEPPTVPAPFVGRALELQALVRMLRRRRQSEVRLLTLWGERGVGKSALGKAVAQFLWQRRCLQDGAAFVELAGVTSEAAALGALGDALDMEFGRWKDASRALQRWQGVVVLDGADELLEASPAVVQKMVTSLMHGSQLQVIVTSCIPLSSAIGAEMAVEHPVRIEPLPPLEAARLLHALVSDALPLQLRGSANLGTLAQHEVFGLLRGIPRRIVLTAPQIRQGVSLKALATRLKLDSDSGANGAAQKLPITRAQSLKVRGAAATEAARLAAGAAAGVEDGAGAGAGAEPPMVHKAESEAHAASHAKRHYAQAAARVLGQSGADGAAPPILRREDGSAALMAPNGAPVSWAGAGGAGGPAAPPAVCVQSSESTVQILPAPPLQQPQPVRAVHGAAQRQAMPAVPERNALHSRTAEPPAGKPLSPPSLDHSSVSSHSVTTAASVDTVASDASADAPASAPLEGWRSSGLQRFSRRSHDGRSPDGGPKPARGTPKRAEGNDGPCCACEAATGAGNVEAGPDDARTCAFFFVEPLVTRAALQLPRSSSTPPAAASSSVLPPVLPASETEGGGGRQPAGPAPAPAAAPSNPRSSLKRFAIDPSLPRSTLAWPGGPASARSPPIRHRVIGELRAVPDTAIAGSWREAWQSASRALEQSDVACAVELHPASTASLRSAFERGLPLVFVLPSAIGCNGEGALPIEQNGCGELGWLAPSACSGWVGPPTRRTRLAVLWADGSEQLARALTAVGVGAVVCLRLPLSCDLAATFTAAFLPPLLAGEPISAAFAKARAALPDGAREALCLVLGNPSGDARAPAPASDDGGGGMDGAGAAGGGGAPASAEPPSAATLFATQPPRGAITVRTPALARSNLLYDPYAPDRDYRQPRLSASGSAASGFSAESADGHGPAGLAGEGSGEEGGALHGGDCDGSTLVGRRLAIHQLVRSCMQHHLTALYGQTGVGKSAVARGAASYARARRLFPGGAFVADMRGVTSTKELCAIIARTLGVDEDEAAAVTADGGAGAPGKESKGATTRQKLIGAKLRERGKTLLVLDRCESAVQQCSKPLCWFLQQLCGLSSIAIVITSQLPLPEDADALFGANVSVGEVELGALHSTEAAQLLADAMRRQGRPITAEQLGAVGAHAPAAGPGGSGVGAWHGAPHGCGTPPCALAEHAMLVELLAARPALAGASWLPQEMLAVARALGADHSLALDDALGRERERVASARALYLAESSSSLPMSGSAGRLLMRPNASVGNGLSQMQARGMRASTSHASSLHMLSARDGRASEHGRSPSRLGARARSVAPSGGAATAAGATDSGAVGEGAGAAGMPAVASTALAPGAAPVGGGAATGALPRSTSDSALQLPAVGRPGQRPPPQQGVAMPPALRLGAAHGSVRPSAAELMARAGRLLPRANGRAGLTALTEDGAGRAQPLAILREQSGEVAHSKDGSEPESLVGTRAASCTPIRGSSSAPLLPLPLPAELGLHADGLRFFAEELLPKLVELSHICAATQARSVALGRSSSASTAVSYPLTSGPKAPALRPATKSELRALEARVAQLSYVAAGLTVLAAGALAAALVVTLRRR